MNCFLVISIHAAIAFRNKRRTELGSTLKDVANALGVAESTAMSSCLSYGMG